ncbi:MAG: GAF domain-containing protein [Pseudomonadota bacterium]
MAAKGKGMDGAAPALARLRRELAASRAREAATAAILKVIRRSPNDAQAVFDAIVKTARKLLDGRSVVMLRVEGDMLHLLALTSTSTTADRFARSRFPMPVAKNISHGTAIRTRRPHVTHDTEKYPHKWREAREQARKRGYRSIVGVPMLRQGKPIGSIAVTRVQPGGFSRHEIRILETFADQAVIAIENARSFRQTKEALEQQKATGEILGAMSASIADTKPVFERILVSCERLFAGRRMGISVLGDDGKLHLGAYRGPGAGKFAKLFPMPADETSGAGAAIINRRVMHYPDVQHQRGVPLGVRRGAAATGTRSVIFAPLLWEGAGIGAIFVGRSAAVAFSDKEIELLKAFAHQAAIAIKNVRLFNETKEALERQTATAEILRIIASSPSDVQPVFDAIAASALRLIGGVSATVTRLVGDTLHLAALTTTSKSGDNAVRRIFPVPVARSGGTMGRVAQTRVPVYVTDTEADRIYGSAYRKMARARGFRSTVGVPMLREGKVIGTIVVTRKDPGSFSPHQISLLQTFADQAVIAIENVRLFNETKEALERQTATAEILKVIASSPDDVQPVFDAIAQSARRLLDGLGAAVTRVEGDAINLVALTSIDRPGEQALRKAFPQSIATAAGHHANAIRGRAPSIIKDVETYRGLSPQALDGYRARGVRALLAVPMMRGGEAIGTIAVSRGRPGPFDEHEIGLLKSFADQAVIAIENVRLFNETREALERQIASSEILGVIAGAQSDASLVFQTIARNARRLTGAVFCNVLRYDGEMLHVAATEGFGEEALQRARAMYPMRPSLSQVSGRVIQERSVIRIGDAQSDQHYNREYAATGGWRRMLGVPMLRDGNPLGVIVVAWEDVGETPDAQVDLLKSFADQAVIAIENVRLFNETKEALERQTATAEILKVIASSPSDVQPVFDAIVRSAARLFNRRATLRLVVPEGLRRVASSHAELVESGPPELMPLDRDNLSGRVVLGGKAIQVVDTLGPDAPPYARAHARTWNFRSNASAPLIREGKVIGAVAVQSSEPGALTDKQMALLGTFADQAVIAIQNARLFNETKEALERQTATAEILKVIASSPSDVQPVFDAIVRSCQRLFSGQVVVLTLVEEGRIVPRASIGAEDVKSMPPWPLDRDSATGACVLDGQTINIGDTQLVVDRFPRMKDLSIRLGYRSGLYVPLRREGSVIGTLNVVRKDRGAFAEREVSLAETFTDQAVIAIENVRLFNETKEALERQTATAEILKVIASSPSDVQPVFEAIARNALALCGSSAANVYRYDGKQMHFVASAQVAQELVELLYRGYPRPPDRSRATGRAILSKQVVRIEDALADPDYDQSVVAASGWRRMFAAPMLREGEPIGAIALNWPDPGPIPANQEMLLKTFADQAVIAIENVRLFNETKESLERQTATAEILKVIASSPADVQPVFDAIAGSATQLLGGFSTAVVRVVGEAIHLAAFTSTGESGDEALKGVFPLPVAEAPGNVGRAIREKTAHWSADIEADPSMSAEFKAVIRARGWRSGLAVPMLRHGEVIGAINVTRREPGPFTLHQIGLLTTFADQAVIAIENVRLFNETKEALERQTATAEILKVIASSPSDVQPVFDAIVQSGARLFPPCNATIMMRDGAVIRLSAVAGPSVMNIEEVRAQFPVAFEPKGVFAAQAIAECRIIRVSDTEDLGEDHARAKAVARSGGYRAFTMVPLAREGTGIGAIALTHPLAGFLLPEKQLAMLQTFADQAVIAIENVRLFNETKEALERQTATAEILRVISSSPTDTQPVFEAIAKSAARLFSGQGVGILLAEGDRLQLGTAVGSIDLEIARKRYPLPLNRETLSGRVILDKVFADVADTESPDTPELLRVLARELGYRAISSAPMMKEGKAIGAITVVRSAPGALAEKEIALLRTFADQAVIAIENVRLFKELQARTEALTKSVGQLTALGEVGQAISSTLELETVLQTIVKHAVQLGGLDAGGIYEYDEASEEFHLRTVENMSGEVVELLRSQPIRKGEGAVGTCAVTREPVQVPDIQNDSYHSRLREILMRAGRRAVLAVPLLREDHIIGALAVQKVAPGPFAPEVVELLKTFATQSAMAIQNARLFREIAEKGRQLEVASQHKSQFLASMSHELRTPLNAILGFNEMLLGEVYGAVPADMKEPLGDIQTSGKHLLRLINNVLDLAKIEAGRMELALSDYSVQDTVESVRSTLRPLAADKGLEFLASVPADIPLAYGDAGRIAQCLMNLAGNSLKFTRQGKVEISVQQQDGSLRYCVADTGMGIPPEKIGSLFTEFKQTDATIASEYGGTGLGLSITKKFIEMHGGRIWVESEVGKGSTFIFEVPLRAKA